MWRRPGGCAGPPGADVPADQRFDGYLARLGLDRPVEPTLEALVDLHRAQVERIPYTTIDIHLGRPCPLDPAEAVARIARTGRAGYCYNLNGALATLLRDIGYEVREHRGWVWSAGGDASRPFPNHLALSVHGLPSHDNPGGGWLVDAGLGDAIHEPLPLLAGEYSQGPFRYGLETVSEPVGWRFRHDPAGSFGGFDLETADAGSGAFDTGHRVLSTSPVSGFVRNVIVARRDGCGADNLVNRTVTRVEGARTVEWEIRSDTEWFAAVADLFGLTLDDLDQSGRDRLWDHAVTGHAAALERADRGPG
jgi:N-hydroxyarylamine O-acetyltransferase